MQYTEDFADYELIDMANGEKLEKWGKYILVRPDPQIIWKDKKTEKWDEASARYDRSSSGGGHWEITKGLPTSWQIKYKELMFNVKLMGFKHTGIFPEQAVNWEYMMKKIKDTIKKEPQREIKVLNLFAYTGGATVACLSAGASVCHVDSSKGIVAWAKENVSISKLDNLQVRYIVDDVFKFVQREIRRGNKYDCIIMDPPSYGRGLQGEVWNIEKDLFELLISCTKLLSRDPLFLIINTYTGGLSGIIIQNVLRLALEKSRQDLSIKGFIDSQEIGIKMNNENLFLPCGITTKWQKKEAKDI